MGHTPLETVNRINENRKVSKRETEVFETLKALETLSRSSKTSNSQQLTAALAVVKKLEIHFVEDNPETLNLIAQMDGRKLPADEDCIAAVRYDHDNDRAMIHVKDGVDLGEAGMASVLFLAANSDHGLHFIGRHTNPSGLEVEARKIGKQIFSHLCSQNCNDTTNRPPLVLGNGVVCPLKKDEPIAVKVKGGGNASNCSCLVM